MASPRRASRPALREHKRRLANDRIHLGIIGVADRGFHYHLNTFQQFPDVAVTAVCDVRGEFVDRALGAIYGPARGYKDYRKLLEQKDLDAVIIATPPHWHALMATAAMEAGKDVLCEKPMSRFPMEALMMAKGAAKFKRVTQVGTQVHATENYRRCVDVVRSGVLGKITAIRNFCTMNDQSEGLGTPPDTDPPADLDWNAWLGPAPSVPYNEGRFRDGMHRYFKDYVDSWLHELGPHIVDLPVWAAGLGQPLSVTATAGRYAAESLADVPDTMDVIWEYPDLLMTWTLCQANGFNFGVGGPGGGRRIGVVFQGTEGTLIANYSLLELYDKTGNRLDLSEMNLPEVTPKSPGHEREFIECIKSREQPSCSFVKHLPLHVALNLAHVSLRLGRKLNWDADKFVVIKDKEATEALTPKYRGRLKLPIYRGTLKSG